MILSTHGIIGSSGATALLPKLLDTYSGATGAYSLRKLRTAYSGNAIRVRRSSDNAELNIAFNADGNLDTVSLLAFVGSGNGFVTTWYDQSGRTNNVINTTATQQPTIIQNGVIITQFGKPTIKFDGAQTVLSQLLLDYTLNGLTSMGIITVFNTIADNSTSPRGLMYIGPDSGWGTIAKCASIGKIGWRFGTGQSNNTMTYNLSPNINSSITSVYHNNNTEILRMNGVDKISYTDKLPTIANTGQQFSIGHNYLFGPVLYHSGTISEMIIFTTNQISNRATIETAINTNYGVY